ncbi:MAG: PAS domain S-box protein [Candidatus Hodarchaeota archaeon]
MNRLEDGFKNGNSPPKGTGEEEKFGDVKRSEKALKEINEVLLDFDTDYLGNIEKILKLATELVGAKSSFYNILVINDGEPYLQNICSYNAPAGYDPNQNLKTNICYKIIEDNSEGIVEVDNLKNSDYLVPEGYDKYVGMGIKLASKNIGVFCILFPDVKKLTGVDLNILSILARAVENEENRHQTEEKLNISENKFRYLIDTMNDACSIVDETGKITYANPRLSELTGKTHEELVGASSTDLFRIERKQVIDEQFNLRKSGQSSRYELTFYRDDGVAQHCIVSGKPIIDGQGKYKGSFSVITDISQLKEAEIILKRERDKAQTYLDIAGVMMIVLDSEGNISLLNKKGCEILECDQNEMLGKNWFDIFIPEKERDAVKDVFNKIMAGEMEVMEYYDNPVITLNGNEKHIHWHNTIIIDDGGNRIGTLSSGEDITEQKRAQEKIQIRLAIERMIDSISTELIKTAPHELDKSLEKALEIIGIFCGADRAIIGLIRDGYFLDFINEWCDEGVPSKIENNKDIDLSKYPKFLKRLQSRDIINLYDFDQVFPQGIQFLNERDVKSFFVVPILLQDEVIGILGLISVKERKTWSNDLITPLKIIAEIFGNALIRDRWGAELIESERLYRNTINGIDSYIYVIDENYKILACNKNCENWLKKLGIIEGNKFNRFEKLFSTLPENVKNEYERVFSSGEPLISLEHLALDGKEFHARVKKIPLMEKGKVVRIISVIDDITQEKLSEKQLKESSDALLMEKEFTEMALNAQRDTFMVFDIEIQKAVRWNKAFNEVSGYSDEEISNFSDFTNYFNVENIHNLSRTTIQELLKNKVTFNEVDLITKNGTKIPFEHVSTGIFDKGGNLKYIVTVGRNISTRKMAEAKLRMSEATLRSIFQAAPVGIGLVSERVLKRVNDEFCKMVGYSPDELIGKSVRFLYPTQEDYEYVGREKYRQIAEKGTGTVETRFICKGGRIINVLLSSSPLDPDNLPLGVTFTALDITERILAENLIKQELVKLKQLDQVRNEFVYRASHELKTPLNSIMSAAQLLRDYYRDQLDDKSYMLVKLINQGGERLAKLVESLIDSFRFEIDNRHLEKSPENIVTIINYVIEDMTYQLAQRDLRIELKLPEKVICNVDKTRFEQVMLNIIGNAIKNTPSEGLITVGIKLLPEWIEIFVKDTGVGITPEEKEQLFRKFGKIERYGKGMDIISEGSGLGLYLSKQIIELHGGFIRVESEGRNKGAEFIIRLPR